MKNKLKRVRVSGSFFVHLIIEGQVAFAKCIRGLPRDARFEYCMPSVTYGTIEIVVSSDEFPEIVMGEEIPLADNPIFEKLQEPKDETNRKDTENT